MTYIKEIFELAVRQHILICKYGNAMYSRREWDKLYKNC